MGDGLRFADHGTRLRQQLDHPGLGLLDGAAGQLVVGGGGGCRVGRLPAVGSPCHRQQPAVTPHDGAGGQAELPPPHDVGGVAERADHGDARSFVRIGQLVSDHRHRHPEQGGAHQGAEEHAVALVVGMGHQGHTGRQQFGTGGLDVDGTAPVQPVEPQPVVGAGELAVLHLGLGDGGAEVDVPQGGGGALDHLAPPGQVEEAPLRDPLGPWAHGGVGV